MSNIEDDIEQLLKDTKGAARPVDKVIARLDHQLGYLHSISVALDRLPDKDLRLMVANTNRLLASIQSTLWFVVILLATIAGKLWFQ